MGEYAYDFTGENAHDGPSRNPHDLAHMTGGSSGGSGCRGRGRAGAARARLRHQRLDPRARIAVRHVRPQADLWPALARRHVSVRREPRSSRAIRALGRRPRGELRCDAGRRTRAIPRRPRARSSRPRPPSTAGVAGPAHRAARRLFRARRASPPRSPRSSASPSALQARRGRSNCRRPTRARAAAYTHHDGRRRGAARSIVCETAADGFRSGRARPADRRRDAAGRLGR